MPTRTTVTQFSSKSNQQPCQSIPNIGSTLRDILLWSEGSKIIVGTVLKDIEEDSSRR